MNRLEPPTCELLDEESTKEMLKVFKGEKLGWVIVGEKKWFLPKKYAEDCEEYYNFQARPDDTWIFTFPRSGTTWTQELIWLLSNDLDFETARKTQLVKRFPFLEYNILHQPEVTRVLFDYHKGDKEKEKIIKDMDVPGYKVFAKSPSPRFLKSHLSLSLLPRVSNSGCKIVYVARNPKDVAVSWYYMCKSAMSHRFIGDFATFWDYFEKDRTSWSPYWEHLKEGWARRHQPNFLFLFYEEMTHDYSKAVRKVANFLGKNYTDEQINKVTDYLNFENFRNNPMVNCVDFKKMGVMKGDFIRKGKTDGWRDDFTPELNAKADKWIEENLKGTDLIFPHCDCMPDKL